MADAAGSAIEIDRLSKRYTLGATGGPGMLREAVVGLLRRRPRAPASHLWALRDVSLDVKPGEVLGVVGRNGSGKSTLLKILSRITRPTTGSARVRGRVASLLEVGTGFHEELSGRENVYLSGAILGMPRKRIAARFDEIVDFAGVAAFIDTPIKRYSSGMLMRLGFAVAAHLESDVLLVDEVIAVGDAEFQRKCLETMGDLGGVGRTVLFVSHNLAAVENLCTRAVWLDGGVLRHDGAPRDVIQRYMASFPDARGGEVDLDAIRARRGTGEVRFTRIEILDAARRPAATVASGDSVVIRLHYRPTQRIDKPVFGLEIATSLGTLVAQIHTYNSGVDLPSIGPEPGYVDVELPELNLAPGRYYLSVSLASLGYVFYDVVDHCAIVDVQPSSRYGLNLGLKGGAVLALRCRWDAPQARPVNGHSKVAVSPMPTRLLT
jgi:lipopolysaccharide transport system ATP-binding protein